MVFQETKDRNIRWIESYVATKFGSSYKNNDYHLLNTIKPTDTIAIYDGNKSEKWFINQIKIAEPDYIEACISLISKFYKDWEEEFTRWSDFYSSSELSTSEIYRKILLNSGMGHKKLFVMIEKLLHRPDYYLMLNAQASLHHHLAETILLGLTTISNDTTIIFDGIAPNIEKKIKDQIKWN